MTVTGKYCNKILMALYTVHVSCLHVLHTQVKHILLHNGNTDTEYEARQHFEWPHVSSQALLRDSSSHTTLDLCTGGLRFLHQVQYRFNLCTRTNVDLKTSKLKWGWGVLNMYPVPLLSTLLIEA